MTLRTLPWASLAAYVLLASAGTVLQLQTPTQLIPAADEPGANGLVASLVFPLTLLVFATVGALVASRRPRNPIGWLLCASCVLNGLYFLLLGYGQYAIYGDPGSLPAGDAAAWLSNIPNDIQWALFVAMLLLFPDGSLPSRRWRPVLWLALGVNGAELLQSMFAPGRLDGFSAIANPVGVEWASFLKEFDGDAGASLFLLIALAALVVRYRGADLRGRQQQKPFLFATTLVGAGVALYGLADSVIGFSDEADLVSGFVIVCLFANQAVALGVSVLRHRLYDVDLVIRRTAVYAVLTAALVGAYLGSVLLLQQVLSPDSDFAIAGSTLAVAALFRPVRSRVQELVDRRFYRSRFDAAHTLEGFGTRMRDEVDLETLGGELRGVVADTMQPAHVSLWLREGAR